MTESIKQRIEKIRRGEVPDGYKKTKVGIVPVEWKETHFKNMFSRLLRRNTEKNNNVLTISAQHGLINQEDFFNKPIASEDKTNYFLLNKGEFAYNKSYSNGYPFGAIKCLEMYEKGIVSPLYICFFAREENKCPDFYVHYFEAGKMNKEIQAIAQEGARNHGLLNISVDDFFNSYLIVPQCVEQEKIAEILSAKDRIIELKSKLIEEKRRQKKHLMQQLLTGKKRLPGFNGLWKNTKLKLLAEIDTGNADTQDKVDNGKYPFYVRSETIERIDTYAYEGEAILIPGDGKIGDIYHYTNGKFNFHQRVYKISDFKDCVGKYIYFYLSLFFKRRAMKLTAKATVDSIRREMLTEMNINMPPFEEQKAIAKILSTADKEIEILQQDLEQEKRKKKALMQLLLTGIVRV